MRITARPSITGDHTPASSGGKTRRLRTRMALVSLLAAGLLGVLGMASTTAIASTGMSTTVTTAAVGAGAHAQALPMASLSHFSIDDIVCIYPQGCIFPYVCNSGSYPSPGKLEASQDPIVQNNCSVRVWLHQNSDGSGYATCINQEGYSQNRVNSLESTQRIGAPK